MLRECIGEVPFPAGTAQQTTYSLPYPTSLSGQCTIKNRYCTTNQGCPVTAPQLCCKAKSLIVRRLAEELNASLSAGIDPGIIAGRVTNAGGGADAQDTSHPPLNLIVSGSSHMSRIIPHIKAKGIAVTDLTEKNWHLNAKSLASLVSKIQATSLNALSVLVLDLFGNTSVRFKQADDTLSLAVKLLGEGGVASHGGRPVHPRRDSQGAGQISHQLGGLSEKQDKNLYPSHPQIRFWLMLRQ